MLLFYDIDFCFRTWRLAVEMFRNCNAVRILLNAYQPIKDDETEFKDCVSFCFVTDVDECRSLSDICMSGRCRNTIGSFRCDCYSGYQYTAERMACEGLSVSLN